ncbi:hypothetical protein LHYA1_G006769 [Lachnellula hyalina]|uniref:NAD(P)-binding domain-containing protein n=1 Tax=Lachnellula hyalina TaxID=1316788 RepID=A0A8H8TWG9_9HELO|nr:uncharacterized protein LHYA1_G006769 [Lachnellula hyalina]TVY24402.1 hypothetical protein LHYA1_G006769 [Lachnellula hyalina]
MVQQQYKYADQLPAGSKNRIEKIAIVGASGHIGSSITSALLATGCHTLTALTRSTTPLSLPPSIHIARIDYTSPASITHALTGHDALIITLSVTAPPTAMTTLLDCASAAGVPWVLPNYFSSDPTLTRLQDESLTGPLTAETRAHIRSTRTLSYVQLACGFWYEHSLCAFSWGFGFDALRKTACFYDDGTTRITTSTFAQAGQAVAALFSLPVLPEREGDEQATLSRYRDGAVYVSSFRVCQRDMFESLLRVTGSSEAEWEIKYRPVGEVYAEGLKGLREGKGAEAFGTCLYSRSFFPTGEGDFTEKLDNEALGLVADESLDEATGRAIDLQKAGYGSYGAGAEIYGKR